MYFTGLLIGIITFILIGAYHPIVIKSKYYFGVKIWPIFLILGIICIGLSLITDNVILSSTLSVLGFINFWSINELK